MKRPVCCVVLAFIMTLMQTGIARAQAPASGVTQAGTIADALSEKIKARVQKIGRNDVTVTLLNRDEHCGAIKSIENDKFVLYEVDMKQLLEISYADVKKVESGYGHSRDRLGRRIPPHQALIGIAIVVGAILVPVILVTTAKN